MFTGIVEEMGQVIRLQKTKDSAMLTIGCKAIMDDLKTGDSVAVNGICLTVISLTKTSFTADVMHETLDRTNLGELAGGGLVNLERAMPAYGRFGGHIVSGHVDGTGIIKRTDKDDIAVWYTIGASPEVLRYIVLKGSITIDGISLTVAGVSDSDFKVSVIPHTAAVTVLGRKKPGDRVNLENDIVAKYIEKLISGGEYRPESTTGKSESKPLNMSFLAANGFI